MLVGIAFNAMYCRLEVGTLALLGVLLTSYMGTQAQAVGQGRAYGGVLGRADRLVLLFLGGLIQLTVAPSGGVAFGMGLLRFGPLEWFMLVFAVLGNATAVQRAVKTWRGRSPQGAARGAPPPGRLPRPLPPRAWGGWLVVGQIWSGSGYRPADFTL